jgi:hypothetical protein
LDRARIRPNAGAEAHPRKTFSVAATANCWNDFDRATAAVIYICFKVGHALMDVRRLSKNAWFREVAIYFLL